MPTSQSELTHIVQQLLKLRPVLDLSEAGQANMAAGTILRRAGNKWNDGDKQGAVGDCRAALEIKNVCQEYTQLAKSALDAFTSESSASTTKKAAAASKQLRFSCPKCSKKLNAPIEMAGKKAKCPFCSAVMAVPQIKSPADALPYGLSVNNPVLCGGGPPGEQAYLDRLRCPSGSRVRYRRGGSSIATDLTFLDDPKVKFYPGKADMGATDEFVRDKLHIDGYEIDCECGKHHVKQLWMDMYHQGPERAIDMPGWSLATPLREHLLNAASVAERAQSPQQARAAVNQIEDILAQEPKLAQGMGSLQTVLARASDAQLVGLCKMLATQCRQWADRLSY